MTGRPIYSPERTARMSCGECGGRMRIVRTDASDPPVLVCQGPTCGLAFVAARGLPPWVAVEVVAPAAYRAARAAVDQPQRVCPDCQGRVRVVRSEDQASGALFFCEDVACGWERLVKRVPSGADITIDEARIDQAVALRRPQYRRRGL